MTPKKDHASGLEKVKQLLPKAKAAVICNVKKQTPLNIQVAAVNWSNIFDLLDKFI